MRDEFAVGFAVGVGVGVAGDLLLLAEGKRFILIQTPFFRFDAEFAEGFEFFLALDTAEFEQL